MIKECTNLLTPLTISALMKIMIVGFVLAVWGRLGPWGGDDVMIIA